MSPGVGGSAHHGFQSPEDLVLGLDSNQAIDLATAGQDHQERNTPGMEPRGGIGIFIDVELGEPHTAGQFTGELVEHRGEHAARTTPGRPEIEKDRDRPAFDLGGEVLVGDGDGLEINWYRGFAASADWAKTSRNFVERDPIGGITGWATDESRLHDCLASQWLYKDRVF